MNQMKFLIPDEVATSDFEEKNALRVYRIARNARNARLVMSNHYLLDWGSSRYKLTFCSSGSFRIFQIWDLDGIP